MGTLAADQDTPEIADARLRFIEYAKSMGGATERAAKDGYDIRIAVIDDVLAQLLSVDSLVSELIPRGATWEDRPSPDEHAFALLDRVQELVIGVDKPTAVRLEVSRVVRLFVPMGSGNPLKVTAVLVHVTSPITATRTVVYRAE